MNGSAGLRIVLVDCHDSFTWNLAHYLADAGADVEVVISDRARPQAVLDSRPAGVVVSPGPGRPEGAGQVVDLARAAAERDIPFLGVCLGMQAIAIAFGGRVVRAPRPVHGKTAEIHHDGRTLFDGLPSPFRAMRYHSLAVERASLPETVEISAVGDDGVIMALRHRGRRVEGVQFHPESALSEHGRTLLANFLGLAGGARGCCGEVRRA